MGAKMPATLVLNVRFRDRLTDWAMTALGRFDPSFTVPWECRKFWGHAATAIGGCRSLAGRNLCPKSEPRVPL